MEADSLPCYRVHGPTLPRRIESQRITACLAPTRGSPAFRSRYHPCEPLSGTRAPCRDSYRCCSAGQPGGDASPLSQKYSDVHLRVRWRSTLLAPLSPEETRCSSPVRRVHWCARTASGTLAETSPDCPAPA